MSGRRSIFVRTHDDFVHTHDDEATRMIPRIRQAARASAGFTFVEVLFAIIILGIGSIMLAGMLPVAIKQTDDARNEIAGRALCEAGYAYVRTTTALSQYGLPYTTTGGTSPLVIAGAPTTPAGMLRMIPMTYAAIAANATPAQLQDFATLSGSRISSSDPRFQWLAFYSRDVNAPSAKLVVLALHLSNTDWTLLLTDVPQFPAYNSRTLQMPSGDPHLLGAVVEEGGALDQDLVTLTATAEELDAADTGAFLIVANQNAAAPAQPTRNVGRVFRLGLRRFDVESARGVTTSTTRIFELQTGYDLPRLGYGPDGILNTADDIDTSLGSGTGTQVWMVGRGLKDPTDVYGPNNQPTGPVQDVAVLQVTMPAR